MLRPTYRIVTARLLLRPLRLDDLDALFAIHSRPDVVRYLYWQPRTRAEVQETIVSLLLDWATFRDLSFSRLYG